MPEQFEQAKRATLYFGSHRKVVHSSVDSALRGAAAFRKNATWSDRAQDQGLLVDLSKVTWFEISACVRLVLFVERALRDGLKVNVALPNPNVLSNELEWLDEAECRSRAERRKDALRFLERIEFRKAMSCPHLEIADGQLRFLERYDRSDEDESDFGVRSVAENGLALEEERYRHRRIVHVMPLRWVSVEDIELTQIRRQLEIVRDAVVQVVGHETRGILQFDAEAFANVVFHELLINVQEHAGVGHCLLGIWARRAGQFFIEDEYPDEERSFFSQWVEPNRFPVIDAALGDSGPGIHKVLREAFKKEPLPHEGVPREYADKEEGIVFWSLGRWSSSRPAAEEKRGTRGLHRVHRLVKGYNGQLNVRTGTVLAGWNHGGDDLRESIARRGLPTSPGTFVSVRFTAQTKRESKVAKRRVGPPRNVRFIVGPAIEVQSDGLATELAERLSKLLSTGSPDQSRCVIVALSGMPKDLEALKHGFERTLDQLRDVSNPGALVLLSPAIPPGQLDTYVNSVSEELGRGKRHRSIDADFDVTNPFMVVDRVGNIQWSGIFEWERGVFEAFEKRDGKPLSGQGIERLLDGAISLQQFLVELRQHEDLFRVVKDTSSLRFTVQQVFDFIEEKVGARLNDMLDDPLQRGVLSGPLRTPSLQVVEKWVRCAELFQQFGWFEVDSASLDKLHRRKIPKQTLRALEERAGQQWYTSAELCEELAEDLQPKKIDYTKVVLHELASQRGNRMPMLALGITLHRRLKELREGPEDIGMPDFVVYDAHSSREIAEGLNAWLGLSRPAIPMPVLIRPGDLSEVWEVIDDKKVLIYCDVVLTGNSVRQILNSITRSGGKSVVIACIFDQRGQNNGQPIQEAGEEIPVVSLVLKPDMVLDEYSGPLQTIDAQTGAIVESSPGRPILTYPITKDECIDFSKETKALFFNHFVLSGRGHFTFHLEPSRLFHSARCVEATVSAITEAVEQFDENHGSKRSRESSVLTYLGTEIPEQILSEIQQRVGIGKVKEIQRYEQGADQHTFSAEVFQQHTIALLWSASSGSRVSRIVYDLARTGAKSVQVFVWLSRIKPEQEEILRSISALQVDVPASSQIPLPVQGFTQPGSKKSRVPVRIAFLASAAFPTFSEQECPVCALRRRFRQEYRGYPSKYLRQFADKMVETFRPKDLGSAAELEMVDCFEDRLTQNDCAEMLRLQRLIEEATRRTETRLEMLEIFRDTESNLHNGGPEFERARLRARALFRLFATQLEFFKMPPFNFEEFRGLMARIASRALLALPGSFSREVLRQAVICFRASDKRLFAQNLPALAEHHNESPVLLRQLLYDTFTYINQDYHQHPTFLEPLDEALQKVVSIIEEKIPDNSVDFIPVHSMAQNIHGFALRRYKQLDHKASSPQRSWRSLIRIYDRQFDNAHEELPAAAKALFPGPLLEEGEGPIAGRLFWDTVRRRWKEAQIILEREVFPQIRSLLTNEGSSLLDSGYAQTILTAADFEFLSEVSIKTTSSAITDLGDLLAEFSSKAPTAADDSWRRFRALRERFRNVLLELPNGGEGALLHRLLENCPCSLDESIEKALANENWKRRGELRFRDSNGSAEIFCHVGVVDELIEEVLSNALDNHRIPGAAAVVEFQIIEEEQHYLLVIRNSGSDPNHRNHPNSKGRGLARVQRLLEPYGCSLIHRKATSPWDYEISAAFMKGS